MTNFWYDRHHQLPGSSDWATLRTKKSEMAIIFLEMIRMEKSWAKHVGTTKTIDY
jgi:hypothetical protein